MHNRSGMSLLLLGLAVSSCVIAQCAPGGFSMFEKSLLPTGFDNRAWLPNVASAEDGAIYCAFCVDIKSIWVIRSDDAGKTWTPAVKVMECPKPGDIADPNILCVGDKITVFANFGPAPRPPFTSTDTLASTSTDRGQTWSPAKALPIPRKYICGKIHVPIRLDDGAIVMGYSYDVPAEEGRAVSEEHLMHLRAGVLISHDEGETWTAGGDIDVDIANISADEPAIIKLKDGSIFNIFRTFDAHPYETISHDGGLTWEDSKPSEFYGHNSPSALLRLKDGAIIRVWDNSPSSRYPLVASISTDECKTWSAPRTITEPGFEIGPETMDQASYPSIAQAPDDTIVVVWWETAKGAQISNIGVARFTRQWVEEEQNLPVVVAFGDSVTLGTRPGIAEQDTFRARLGIALRNDETPIRILNAGIGSSNTRDALDRMNNDVLRQNPKVVIVTFGINDAAMVDEGPTARTEPRVSLEEYKDNLRHIVRRAQRSGARVILCTPTPMSRAYAYSNVGVYAEHEDINYLLGDYARAARDVAESTGARLVDLFKLFTEREDDLAMIEDGNHPWPAGHVLIADALEEPIKEELALSKTD